MTTLAPWWRDRPFLLALAAIVLLGAGLRVARLDALPPGLAFDEAWEGIDGARILAGARPLFLPANNGREPAFAYTVAVTIALLGQAPLAVRAAAALWGIATIPAMALLGGVLGGRRLALAAAGLVAFSYWPLHLSRVGLRPVALPPLEAAGMALLLFALAPTALSVSRRVASCPSPRGRRDAGGAASTILPTLPLGEGQGEGVPGHQTAKSSSFHRQARAHWLPAVAAGAALGLQLYTYLPARLTVVVGLVAVGLQVAVLGRRRAWCRVRRVLGAAAVIGIVAALVALPLALHYVRHTEDWLGRSDQVSVMNAIRTGADPVAVIGGNLRATLGALAFRGDMQARHNLPGRPIFDPWSAGLFVVGLAVVWRRLGGVAAAAVVTWLVTMLIPAVLSDSAPHFLRAAGALPPLFLIVAVGLVWTAETAARVLGRPPAWAYAAAAVPLALTGLLTTRDYFVRFADPAVSFAPFEADVRSIAESIAGRAVTDTLVGPIAPEHPVLRFLIGGTAPATFPIQALPLRPGDYFVRTIAGPDAAERLIAAFPGAERADRGGVVELRVPAGATPMLAAPSIAAQFDFGAIELLGADAEPAAAGTELPLRLRWRAKRPVAERLTVFVHLVDERGVTWAQEDMEPGAGGYPTTGWRPGETVIDDRRLPLAPGIPPGTYTLRVGLVRPGGVRLPLVDAPGDFATLGPARIERGVGRLNLWRLPLASRPERDLAAGAARVDLVGFRLEAERVEAGRALPLLLVWEWRGAAPGARVEVGLGPGERPVASAVELLGGRWPSDRWQPGELVQQRVELAVPAAAAAGDVDVWLRLIGAGGERSAVVPIGRARIDNRPRDFAPPHPSQPLAARFGTFAELAGFDAPARVQAGGPLAATLYWRALATPPEDYVVFLHLIDAADRVRGQVDAPPGGGRAPTRSWLPGETIVDARSFVVAPDAPPGEYRLEAGLYRPEDGRRVALADGSGDRVVFGQVAVQP